ncbi:hypothetical protein [Luteolibacter soli]
MGLFVLVFLGWAWRYSYGRGTEVYRVVTLEDAGPMGPMSHPMPRALYDDGVSLDSGRMVLSYTRVVKVEPGFRVDRTGVSHMHYAPELGGKVPAFRAGGYRDAEVAMATVWRYRVEVPVWAMAGIWVMVWCGVLWWRWRRMKRSGVCDG